MVRLMDAGRDGLDLRRNLVDAMWNDAHMRKKQLGVRLIEFTCY